MNRRMFAGGLGAVLAASAVWGPGAVARAGRAPMEVDRVALGAGWLRLYPAEGRVVAHGADGGVRWERSGLGLPRAAVVAGDRVWVSDAHGWVHGLDLQGNLVDRLAGFHQPWGLVARPDGLHVADRLGHQIVVVGPTGGRRTYGDGLNGPAGLAADGDRTWVADGGHERVVCLDRAGRLIQELRAPFLWRPRAVAVVGDRIHTHAAVPAVEVVFQRGGRVLAVEPLRGEA